MATSKVLIPHMLGKARIAANLVKLFPEHEVFVDPMFGSGAVLWAKEPNEKKVVISEIDPVLAGAYRFVKNADVKDFDRIRKERWVCSAKELGRWWNFEPKTDEACFKKAFYIAKNSFGSYRTDAMAFCHCRPGRVNRQMKSVLAELEFYSLRLQNTEIRNQDAIELLKEGWVDKKNVFLFLDPPYRGEAKRYCEGGNEFDFDTFFALLNGLKRAKWMLTINSLSETRDFARKYHTKRLKMRRTVLSQYTYDRSDRTDRDDFELVIANYPLPEVKKIEKSVSLQDILEQVTHGEIGSLSNEELTRLHGRLHEYWVRAREKNQNFNLEDLVNSHLFVMAEMMRRDLRHKAVDVLDTRSAELGILRVHSLRGERAEEEKFGKALFDTSFDGTGFLAARPGVTLDRKTIEQIVSEKPEILTLPDSEALRASLGAPIYLVDGKYAYAEIIPTERISGADHQVQYRVRYQEIYEKPKEVELDDKNLVHTIIKSEKGDQLLEAVSEVEDLVVVSDFVSLTGSSVSERESEDLDIVIRADELEDFIRMPKRALLMKLSRAVPEKFQDELHFIMQASGPTWSYVPLFDLVLRRKPKLDVVEVDESYAYYKLKKVKPVQLMKPFTPIKSRSGYHEGEWFIGEEDQLWETWARGYAEDGVVVQPKYDGIRLVMHRDSDKVAIFTEDKKRNRADVLPSVVEALRNVSAEQFIIDTEVVLLEDGKPALREEMMELVVGKKPITQEMVVNVHDLLFLSEPINSRPYLERIETVHEVFKEFEHQNVTIRPSIYWVVKNQSEFDTAIEKASDYLGSEGAMLKWSKSQYDSEAERVPDWAKIKRVKEIAGRIIGIHRKARAYAGKELVTGDDAIKRYQKLSKDSETYQFRVAIKGENGALIPFYTKKKLTNSDLDVKWNPELSKPAWQGIENDLLWEMADGFRSEPGKLQFASTYAKNYEIEPKLGMIVTVRPVQITQFEFEGHKYLSWMFPKTGELKPDQKEPDSLKEIRDLITESR